MNDQSQLFSRRPEWQDVTPLIQHDGPSPLVPIAYSPDYSDAMDYFRAIINKKEYSPRVLELTQHLIRLNPSHYTVWKYRLETVLAIDADLHRELAFVEEMAEEQPKSYQTWHYRQGIIEKLNDGTNELAFVNRMLRSDSKNYHAWSYRQWVVAKFDLWDGEMLEMAMFIDADLRNNSAWNQRYWVVKNRPKGHTAEELDSEVQFAVEMIYLAPRNESAWSYIRGTATLANKPLPAYPALVTACKDYAGTCWQVPHALAMQLDIELAQGHKAECEKLCQVLAEHDPIRKKFWMYRAESVK
ncbi:hypothetical protein DFS34DRAFT_629276 [Phlyctochytrium arcticum]|nr:hypothetical protein DFS34DRAFT_629276 [Phlyctochytrium arcticum]